MREPDPRRSRAVLGLLVLACLTVITLDARRDTSGSPVNPLRMATGAVLGPVETFAASVAEPIGAIPKYFGDVSDLRRQNSTLQTANEGLITQLHAAQANSHRSAEVRRIGVFANTAGYSIVPAQVVAIGPAQSFSHTVTIDVGSDAGIAADQTVINADGLVGRVVSVNPQSATILLITDGKSVIGGRLSDSMELGFLTGDGQVGDDGVLKLSLVDHTVSPSRGDVVVTWGSPGGAPYLPGVPVGAVVGVHSSPAELTQTAEVRPYVDFSALDVVGIVTASAGATTAGGAEHARPAPPRGDQLAGPPPTGRRAGR